MALLSVALPEEQLQCQNSGTQKTTPANILLQARMIPGKFVEEQEERDDCPLSCGYAKIIQTGDMCSISEKGKPFKGKFACSRICANPNVASHCSASALEKLGCSEVEEGTSECPLSCGYAKIIQTGDMCQISEKGKPFGGKFPCSRICANPNVASHCSASALEKLGCSGALVQEEPREPATRVLTEV